MVSLRAREIFLIAPCKIESRDPQVDEDGNAIYNWNLFPLDLTAPTRRMIRDCPESTVELTSEPFMLLSPEDNFNGRIAARARSMPSARLVAALDYWLQPRISSMASPYSF